MADAAHANASNADEEVVDAEFDELLARGSELLQSGSIEEARTALERAHRLSPRNQDAQHLLARTYFRMGLFDGAEVLYRGLVAGNPKDADRHVNLGVLLLETGRTDEAVNVLLAAIGLDSSHVKAANYLGLAHARLRDLDAARQWFTRAGNREMLDKLYAPEEGLENLVASSAAFNSRPPPRASEMAEGASAEDLPIDEWAPADTVGESPDGAQELEFQPEQPLFSEPRGSTDPGILKRLMLAQVDPSMEPSMEITIEPVSHEAPIPAAEPEAAPEMEVTAPAPAPVSEAPAHVTSPVSIPPSLAPPRRMGWVVALVVLALAGVSYSVLRSRKQPAGDLGNTPAPGATCGVGLELSADTSGHCCWPGQVWGRGKCVGIPTTCPTGLFADAHAQSCLPPPCEGGLSRTEDGAHCCWGDQAWSGTRQKCVGVPTCPQGYNVSGESCVEAPKEVVAAAPTPTPPPAAAPPPTVALAATAPAQSADEFGETVLFSEGEFHFGCEPNDPRCFADEKPGHDVIVKSFRIQKTEVTVSSWQKCVIAGACGVPGKGGHCNWGVKDRENHPINCVDWRQAKAYCAWIGGRLLTAQEWEYAAKGGVSRVYPWGYDAPKKSFANYDSQSTEPVGSHPEGSTPEQVADLAGNVWEWTATAYDAENKEVRGGSWLNDARNLRASTRYRSNPANRTDNVGVRCGM